MRQLYTQSTYLDYLIDSTEQTLRGHMQIKITDWVWQLFQPSLGFTWEVFLQGPKMALRVSA